MVVRAATRMAMLSQEENALITQTGPGTPGGDLFRRYWQPVALAEELPRGGAPLPVRLLGEDLVLFRDEHRWAHKIRHDCNYLQGHEGNVDPQHLSFLHHQFQYDEEKARLPTVSGTTTTSYALFSADVAPTIDLEETDFGLRMYSVRRT